MNLPGVQKPSKLYAANINVAFRVTNSTDWLLCSMSQLNYQDHVSIVQIPD